MKKIVLALALILLPALAFAQTPQRANTLTPATLPLSGVCNGSPPALPAIGVDVADPSSFLEQASPCALVLAEYGYTYNVPTTGFSLTIAAGIATLALNPAGELATGTIVFPAVAVDRWKITVTSTAAIDAVTFTPGGGATIKGAPAGLAANVPITWQYIASCTCYMVIG